MTASSFNPTASPAGGFSPLRSLVQDALRDLGETSPDVQLSLNEKQLVNAANKVINDINRHPIFLDLVVNAWADLTGCSIAAGSNLLTTPSSATTTLSQFTPIVIAGAGSGGGDLYTFITKPNELLANQFYVADDAYTTVAAAVVSCPYKSRLRLYASITEIRAVDDATLIEGIKYYFTRDEEDRPLRFQVRSSGYYDRLNTWLAGLQNYFGELTVTIRDEDNMG